MSELENIHGKDCIEYRFDERILVTLVVAAPVDLVDKLWGVQLILKFALESDPTIVGAASGKIS